MNTRAIAFSLAFLLAGLLPLLGGCTGGGDSSGILFVNTTNQTLSVSPPGGEAITIEPGKSATAAAWGSANVLVVSETATGGPAAPGQYQVPLVRRGPATITARGPRGQLAFDVADPRQTTSAQDRQIRRDVIDRSRGQFHR